MSVKKVLFVCVHNSARSQMAEAFLNKYAEGKFTAESAGLTEAPLNPYVVDIMKEDEGLELTGNTTDLVFDFFKEGRMYHYVIKVCDQKSSERCPVFPDILATYAWDIADPAKFKGTDEIVKEQVRIVKNQIKEEVINWLNEHR